MKKFKKLSAILLAMIMTMLVALPAMAAAPTRTAKVKVPSDTTYTAYKIFDVEYDDTTVNQSDAKRIWTLDVTSNTEGQQDIFNWLFDAQGAKKDGNLWFNAKKSADFAETDVWEIIPEADYTNNDAAGRAAAEYLKANIPASVPGQKIVGNGTETELEKKSGYYLFVSAGSAGVALADTQNVVDLTNKVANNPTITKKITAVNKIDKPGQKVTASIGDTVSFEVIVTIPVGVPTNKGEVVVTDTSVQGLDIQIDTMKCTKVSDNDSSVKLNNSVQTTGFTFKTTPTEVAEKYTITYDAVLTGNGVDKYDNTASMEFDKVTVKAIASVITNLNPSPNPGDKDDENHGAAGPWTLLKVDEANKLLKGAQFEIYRDADCTNKINFKWAGNTYTATADNLGTEGTTSVIDLTCPGTNGPAAKPSVEILGLAGTVYVKEIKAPAGYNALDKVETIDLDTKFPGKWVDKDESSDVADGTWKKGENGYPIVNKTGALLPSTGGIGTTIFYIAGAILLLGAVVMLVVRRRMDK